ncbi:hypothetical protein [uncultured Brevundimonas sp.]|mgnify:CR=1 FL=1|uniref:hypothetical protein n=1 Tax=uncultured Brevundimonas sp. TaxID=213418 RepID=UPI0025FE21E0|nr:hypothetical protein [uncultured Brevundimonas sp.]
MTSPTDLPGVVHAEHKEEGGPDARVVGIGEAVIDGEDYFVIPEEAFQLLPPEWREHCRALAEDGRRVLTSADPELSQLARLSNSFATLVTLKHIRQRLAAFRFAPEMETLLELDMLTTAFAVTYVRLSQGGKGSGFTHRDLPEGLRASHNEILELRNKRFAHDDAHHSVQNALAINIQDGRFAVELKLQLGFYVGGASAWHQLVDFLDAFYYGRLEAVFERLRRKTGREWLMPQGPGPA